MARQERPPRKQPPRPSWWTALERAAEEAGLRGNRQWALVRFLARLGNSKNRARNVMEGSRKLAEKLGMDVCRRSADSPVPKGKGNHDLDGRNMRHRLQHLHQLKLIRVESPRCVKAGQLALARGGRLPGCSSERLKGRALRIYPGPLVYPSVLIAKQVELDNLADAGLVDWKRVGTPREELTPGQVLEIEQLAEHALHRRRGPPP